jgi:hypothetical protein
LLGPGNERSVRFGVTSVSGLFTFIGNFHGRFVRAGTQFLEEGTTTGDEVEVKGSAVRIQNKQTGDVRLLRLDGCKIRGRQSTPSSRERFRSGTITTETHDLFPERIALDLKADDGRQYQREQSLTSGFWQTRLDQRADRNRTETGSR